MCKYIVDGAKLQILETAIRPHIILQLVYLRIVILNYTNVN